MPDVTDKPPYVNVLEAILKGMCKYPQDVRVDCEPDEMGIKLTINTNKLDTGAVIGREGNTIKAIRTVMRSVGACFQARLGVVIAGDRYAGNGEKIDDSDNKHSAPYRPRNTDLPRATIDDL